MDRPLIGSSGRSGMRQSATLTAPLLLLTLVLGAAAAPAQAQDDLLHRGSQARLDPPAADLTAPAVHKTRRRVEQIALRNLARSNLSAGSNHVRRAGDSFIVRADARLRSVAVIEAAGNDPPPGRLEA